MLALHPSLLSAAAWPRLVERVIRPGFHLTDLPADPGVAPLVLLPGCLDEPLVAVRSGEGLRVLSNACTHRGHLVATAAGPCKRLRCGYHGRIFDLEGRALSSPGFGAVNGQDLPTAGLFTMGPLGFVSGAPAGAPPPWAGALADRLAGLPLSEAVAVGGRDYRVRGHFLLWLENFLEGLHIPFVHPALAGALDLSVYRTDTYDWGNVQVGMARPGDVHLPLPPDHPDRRGPDEAIAGLYVYLYPLTALNIYPWGISANAVMPVSPTETVIRYRSFVWAPALREQGAGAGLSTVEEEDDLAVERTAAGLKGALSRPGPLSPEEVGVAHLHVLLRAALGEGV